MTLTLDTHSEEIMQHEIKSGTFADLPAAIVCAEDFSMRQARMRDMQEQPSALNPTIAWRRSSGDGVLSY